MIGLLYRLIIGRFTSCKHEWEIVDQFEVIHIKHKVGLGKHYDLQCKHCGELVGRDLTI